MKRIIPFLVMVTTFISCEETGDNQPPAVVPKPAEMEINDNEFFRISDETTLVVRDSDEQVVSSAGIFVEDLRKYQSLNLTIDTGKAEAGNSIILELAEPLEENDESYILESWKDSIKISAGSPAGIFHGLMSLEQLILTSGKEKGGVRIPSMKIDDRPRFRWRGMHLDVSRHFMPVEDVKKYLDYLALYKFNTFHWHLTEDQGWRIEIKKYPKLTSEAAWRDSTLKGHYSDNPVEYVKERHGGYYSQEEIKEVVKYAADRFITIVPEIEMPGHAQAAISAYPWLGVTGDEVGVKSEWGISPYIYMPSEKTYKFLEDVLTEVMQLFPSQYIHIGGDEAIKDQWEESEEIQKIIDSLGLKDEHELQSYFIQRMEKFLNDHGRKIVGWDEILEGGLAPNATVMSWRGEEGGIAAARMKHDVVMTPTSYCYFDYYQADPENEPLAIGGYLPIDSVYLYDPVPEELSEDEAKHILGVQANVWTEYMPDFEKVEYMVFPRILAMSEIAWTQPCGKDLKEFHDRVDQQEKLFEKMGINYHKSEN